MAYGKEPTTPPAKPAPGANGGLPTKTVLTLRTTDNYPRLTITISVDEWLSLEERARNAGIGTLGFVHNLLRPNPANHPNRSTRNKPGAD